MADLTDGEYTNLLKFLGLLLESLGVTVLQREVIKAAMDCSDYDGLLSSMEALMSEEEHHDWSCETAFADWRQPPAKHL